MSLQGAGLDTAGADRSCIQLKTSRTGVGGETKTVRKVLKTCASVAMQGEKTPFVSENYDLGWECR